MVVQSPTDIREILRKGDVVALRKALKHWAPSALVRVIANHPLAEEGFR